VFNSRTCQLVLGAGALAAAGLKSITARHLALAAQALGAALALHPALAAAAAAAVPPPRRALLLPEFERVAQVAPHPPSCPRSAAPHGRAQAALCARAMLVADSTCVRGPLRRTRKGVSGHTAAGGALPGRFPAAAAPRMLPACQLAPTRPPERSWLRPAAHDPAPTAARAQASWASAMRERMHAGPLPSDRPESPAQDLAIHRGEIHGKLVAIMRERLAAALAQLPAAAAGWAAAPRAGAAPQPSPLAASSAKQLRILTQARGAASGVTQLHPPPGGGRSGSLQSTCAARASEKLCALTTRLDDMGLEMVWKHMCC